jgi:hypothetical protein
MKNDHPKAAHLRDGAGHLTAGVAADLLARTREESPAAGDDRAFFRAARSGDPLAEQLGEAFVASATGSEDTREETPEELESAEKGGPFVETSGETELALGTDASNPGDATREPFPLT